MTFGFLNLNKPPGYTSHDCVARVRRLLHTKRVGHGGTLDPAAVGVLPIAVGKATRLLQFLPQDKAYQATIKFGLRTETDDLEGEAIESQPVPDLSLESIQLVLSEFQGKIEQIPPIYSAIQVGGKRLYKLARQGEVVQVPARTVEVYDLQVLDWRPGNFPELDLAIACGPGTYIRAIARDLGDRVNAGATLAQLTRTQSSGFRLSQSMTLEELETQVEQQTFTPISGQVALSHLPECILSPSQVRSWFHGQQLSIRDQTVSGTVVRVSSQTGEFLGIGELEQTDLQWVLHPKVVFS
ncbi:MAG: tRNA pseudouridine(55) synthase TruB [Roseofilum sp. SBFL]|uniref:tRNA pseudouridine(55) synthase TruB n=1 Tax=unclassified Roseofilum TaxID=2620099 RepID=UPI001B050CF1|nr:MULTISPECIES: tRNA pseudouridine(55) synthase TruB [unclassified Roseofilum]MBP0013069.1 tRNA pseudouridine(55) synthase TruB [Roseofilum sp. SID3]MBP0025898.1 tRNA pseudouridine(55) synthase TruB [Roseofilum sp. SID2]MBP0038537.1 tRNA pseudouridine(55) synthase TruB [Roseofilum sp. SID1]MBP0041066.1 tRNA pseudouridine(55) synthase TruB [Roseofilum sp. SBFL]